jgi:sec-independent protein translocase protein TatA
MSLVHWIIVGVVVLLLFGKGRFSAMMGDVAKGLKSFKKGMSEDDEVVAAPPPRRIEGERVVDPVDRTRAAEPVERREP